MRNKRELYIVGAGGFGRELESWLAEVPYNERNWELKGYIDDNLNALDNFPSDYKVLGKIEDYQFESALVIIAIAEPKIKLIIYEKLKNRVEFMTFIAKSATISKFVTLDEGVVVCPNSLVSTNTKVGKLVTINCGTQIGHDVTIGDFASFMANVDIGGGCKIGNSVFMGTNSTLIPYKNIYDNVVVGAGAISIRNIKHEGTYFGNPAKKIL